MWQSAGTHLKNEASTTAPRSFLGLSCEIRQIIFVARSKQVCIEWMEATVLFCRDCLREKEIYTPGVRPVRPYGKAPDAPLATPTRPARLTTEMRSPRNILYTSSRS